MSNMIHHAVVLNLHQPGGNLEAMQEQDRTEHETREVLEAYDRIPRAVEGYEDVARVHLSLSGTLLETLINPDFQSRVYGMVKCGEMIWKLRNPALSIVGTGYYHPVLPLIAKADRKEHIKRWQGLAGHLFECDFPGFWPPEMGFSMEMIPLLSEMGFRYVMVDAEKIAPISPMRWEEIHYRPHIARYGDHEMVVIPRDQTLSIAQENGLEPGWFINEVQERTKWCDFEPLICTATDGDNGGWFRNSEMAANFWGAFYQPMCEHARRADAVVKPTFIHDYLDRYGAHGEVIVKTGAWETGEHHGIGFVQWTGSQMQKDALTRCAEVSDQIHQARWNAGERGWPSMHESELLENAMWRLLRAETSCNFFWGEAWTQRCHSDLDGALHYLDQAKSCI